MKIFNNKLILNENTNVHRLAHVDVLIGMTVLRGGIHF